ncbi:MAG: DegV family protein [Corallococcus sp.]|nr:DegV family protein [Corallococcus sp.]MCM1359166.1 DegV family protein [Corallococcus sp.]MCM1394556.1 DegV family protein [Corallococcus sp.]
MTNKYALFMDVSGDLDQNIADQAGVKLLPMDFIIGGNVYTYTDRPDGIDPIDFYRHVKNREAISTTQITPAFYEEYFEPILSEGISALYLCLSSGLSSTFQSACLAAKTLKQKYPDVDLVPIDSLQATVGMGLLGERMIQNKNDGLDIFANKQDVESARSSLTVTGVVDDLDALKRGGRISAAVAVIGGLLNFKPVILVKEDGTLKMSATMHGIKKALKYFVDLFSETHDAKHKTVYVMHADEDKNSALLVEMLLEKFPDLEIRRRLLSPIIGAHLGSGLVGLGFYKKAE